MRSRTVAGVVSVLEEESYRVQPESVDVHLGEPVPGDLLRLIGHRRIGEVESGIPRQKSP
jgi:hypothetical protein